MLVGEEVIAQALHRHTPLLAHDAQIVSLQSRLHLFEALLHFAAIREQGEHRPVLGTVSVDEQALQSTEITRIIGFGHIVDNIDNHLIVEVVA